MIVAKSKDTVNSEEAMAIVQDFVADHLGDLVGVGEPCRLVSGLYATWTVPLVLTSPGYGIVGIVGVVMVDAELGHVVGWTPLDEIHASAERVSSSKEAELEAAYQHLRARNPLPVN